MSSVIKSKLLSGVKFLERIVKLIPDAPLSRFERIISTFISNLFSTKDTVKTKKTRKPRTTKSETTTEPTVEPVVVGEQK